MIKFLHTLKYVEFEENDKNFYDADIEFEELKKQCITGDELIKRANVHIDELFDAKERKVV